MSAKEQLRNGLYAETSAEGTLISGKTFENKEMLKQMKAVWIPEVKMWRLPPGTDLQPLRLQVPAAHVALSQTRTSVPQPVPRTRQVNLYANRPRRYGACCSKCKTRFDEDRPDGPLWYVCPDHGTWKSDYTGD